MADLSVRIIANDTSKKNLRTVNIKTTAQTNKFAKQRTQLTAAQTVPGIHETVMDSGGTVAGLRTIVVPGYSAPN